MIEVRLSFDSANPTMWCPRCQHDVPGIVPPHLPSRVCCARCRTRLESTCQHSAGNVSNAISGMIENICPETVVGRIELDESRGRRNWHKLNRLVNVYGERHLPESTNPPPGPSVESSTTESRDRQRVVESTTNRRIQPELEPPQRMANLNVVGCAALAILCVACVAVGGLLWQGNVRLALQVGLPLAIFGQTVLVASLLFRLRRSVSAQ